MQIKRLQAFLGLSFTLFLLFSAAACKVKEGCPSMNQHQAVGKDGKLSTKPGRSGLFPQGVRRH
jgi:hypothetical protein